MCLAEMEMKIWMIMYMYELACNLSGSAMNAQSACWLFFVFDVCNIKVIIECNLHFIMCFTTTGSFFTES